MKKNLHLAILLPERLADLPIRIIRNSHHEQLVFSLRSPDDEALYADRLERKYVFIWRQTDYVKVALDEIVRIKADRSYSDIRLSGGRSMVISFNLAVVEKELPAEDFIRIHRSCIVNLKHVDSLTGNCLKVGDEALTIGREYRERLLDRFIFLGVRRRKSK